MASQSYAEIQAQIAELASRAQALKAEESAAVVARIREDVAAYGLTVQDIFGRKGAGAKFKVGPKAASGAKYSDGKGGTYGGRGPHPKWLRNALAAGAKLEDFLAGAVKSPSAAAVPAKKAAAKKAGPRKGAGAKKASK
ncbi:MAG: H-NS histone family protein [Burkholderiales bacterium]|nr:H-NS histone family protein [Burkholderiales bacterium]MDE2452543.1 H-NS histone family protein [Burkholderiales bacterium]